MTLINRYKRLTFWNKFSFWGTAASIVGLILAIYPFFATPLGEPNIKLSYEQQEHKILVRNVGVGAARNLQFYPVLFSSTKEGDIYNRLIPDNPSLQLNGLDPEKQVEVPKSAYFRIEDISKIRYPTQGGTGPFLALVLTYYGTNNRHLKFDFFQFFGSEDVVIIPVPLTYSSGVTLTGNFKLLDRTLEQMKHDIVLAFHG